jgi:anti-sigma factor ChrR (cupin superfamily)
MVMADLLQRAQQLKNEAGWEPFHPGIDIQWLYKTGTDGPQAALLRYQPGASAPLHEHTGYEHVLTLDGVEYDQRGQYPAGTLAINPPGSRHEVHSVHGCVVLVIWEKPVRFL